MVARTVSSQLLLARLDLLADETAWLPVNCHCRAVSVFNIGLTGDLWTVDSDSTVRVSSDWLEVSRAGGEPSWSVLTGQLLSRPVSLPSSLLPPVLLPGHSLMMMMMMMISFQVRDSGSPLPFPPPSSPTTSPSPSSAGPDSPSPLPSPASTSTVSTLVARKPTPATSWCR